MLWDRSRACSSSVEVDVMSLAKYGCRRASPSAILSSQSYSSIRSTTSNSCRWSLVSAIMYRCMHTYNTQAHVYRCRHVGCRHMDAAVLSSTATTQSPELEPAHDPQFRVLTSGDLDLWPFELKIGVAYQLFLHAVGVHTNFGSSVRSLVFELGTRAGQTDGRTGKTRNARLGRPHKNFLS